MKVELTQIEVNRIRVALFMQALKHKDLSNHYKDTGYNAIAISEAVEGWALMTLREKFPLNIDTPLRKELETQMAEGDAK